MNMQSSKVYLVGAGPGRADLITLRGAEVIREADCVIYDRLANEELLRFARSDAEIINVPKRLGTRRYTQQQINELLLEKAKAGRTVVRLKGGDPTIFGRAGEEITVLAEAAIDFEIVPGVTAAAAAAAFTGILLTDRNYSSQVVFVTGREAPGKEHSNIDWDLLAKFKGTIVLYMALGTIEKIVRKLTENGMDKSTPAAAITDATLPTQKVIPATLSSIPKKCKDAKLEPPAIILIGPAAASDRRFDWLAKKPLFGKTIVTTRDEAGSAEFAAKIVQQGGNPVSFSTIKLKSLTYKNDFLKTLAKFSQYDWIVFTSQNGAAFFFEALEKLQKDARAFCNAKVAAIGSETAGWLSRHGIKADLVPDVFTSRQLAKQLIAADNLKDKKVLLLRSDSGSKELPELLKKAKAIVDDVPIYQTLTKKSKTDRLTKDIESGLVHWITFASPSAVKSFFEQVSKNIIKSGNTRVASIGPVTSNRLTELGVKVHAEAEQHTIDGLLSAIKLTYM